MASAHPSSGTGSIEHILKADEENPKAVLQITDAGLEGLPLRSAAYNVVHKLSYELHPKVKANNDRQDDKKTAWKRILKAAKSCGVDPAEFGDAPDVDDQMTEYRYDSAGRLAVVTSTGGDSMEVDSNQAFDEEDLELRKGVYQAAERVLVQNPTTTFEERIDQFRQNVEGINVSLKQRNQAKRREADTSLVDPDIFVAYFKEIDRICQTESPNQGQELQQVCQQLENYCQQNGFPGEWHPAEESIVAEPNNFTSAQTHVVGVPAAPNDTANLDPTVTLPTATSTKSSQVPVDGVLYEVVAVQTLSRDRGRVLLKSSGKNNLFRYCLLAASEAVGKRGTESCRQAGIPELSFGNAMDLEGYSGLNLPPCQGVAEIVTPDRLKQPQKFSKRPMTIYLLSTSTKGPLWFRREDAAAQFKKALDGLEQTFLANAGQSSWTSRRAQTASGNSAMISKSSPDIINHEGVPASDARIPLEAEKLPPQTNSQASIGASIAKAPEFMQLSDQLRDLQSLVKALMQQQVPKA